jgi:hypothetical protein
LLGEPIASARADAFHLSTTCSYRSYESAELVSSK